jgi:hypothetical protein
MLVLQVVVAAQVLLEAILFKIQQQAQAAQAQQAA